MAFRGHFDAASSRVVQVVTVEKSLTATTEPRVVVDLPFLEVSKDSESTLVNEDSGVVTRTRNYRLSFARPPASPSFAGTVSISDPWSPGVSKAVRVVG